MYKPDYISNNLVLLQPTSHLNRIGEWVIYDIHDPAHHYTVRGKVLMVPDRLVFNGDKYRQIKKLEGGENQLTRIQHLTTRSVDYNTPMQLKVGDEVIFKYINHVTCKEQGLYWPMGEKNPALFINYDTLFMAFRGKERIMLNGWVWVKPLDYSADEICDKYGVIHHEIGEKKVGEGIVVDMGVPNKGYLHYEGGDSDDIQIGDKVYFKHTAGVSVEWFYHQSLNEGKHPYYAMHRRDILGIEKPTGIASQ